MEPSIDFTLDQLLVLDTVVRQGSFRAAGLTLGRATSAVSYGVSTLEEAVGVPLFDRSGRRAVLTERGRTLLLEARGLIDRARRLEHLAAELRGDWEPTLQIVVDGSLPSLPLMSALGAIVGADIPTRVSVQTEYLSGVREYFEAAHCDVMVSLDFTGSSKLIAHPLPALEMWLVASPEHPLAGKQIQRRDLAGEVELIVHDSARVAPSEDPRLSLGSARVLRLSDFHTKRAALEQGLGVGWLPAHLCEPALGHGALKRLDFPEAPEHTFVPHLISRRGQELGRAARHLVTGLLDPSRWTPTRSGDTRQS